MIMIIHTSKTSVQEVNFDALMASQEKIQTHSHLLTKMAGRNQPYGLSSQQRRSIRLRTAHLSWRYLASIIAASWRSLPRHFRTRVPSHSITHRLAFFGSLHHRVHPNVFTRNCTTQTHLLRSIVRFSSCH